MIKLTDNHNKEYGTYENENEALSQISKIVRENGFKSYYHRITPVNDTKKWVDYGSHTHFFYLETL